VARGGAAPLQARFFDLSTTAQLEALTGRPVAPGQRAALQRVLAALPVRLTPHLLELASASAAVAAQYLPDPRELDPSSRGEPVPFAGLLTTGCAAVERIYRDRCVLLPVAACPAYCRFCFRKFHRQRADAARPPAFAELDRALAYVAAHPELREVLISGGEPALDPERLGHLLRGLRRLDTVGPIRVACRALVSCPELVDDRLVELLAAHQDRPSGRLVELAVHVNHPDELTPPTDAALARLRAAGLHTYSQTVLLAGINDDAAVLARLLRGLRDRGVEIYTLYYPEPLLGSDHLRPSLARAAALKQELRRLVSGRANPRLIITTRVGKLELGVEAEEVAREADGRQVWLRTPYTLEGLRALEPRTLALPPHCRVDEGSGRLEVRYLDGAA